MIVKKAIEGSDCTASDGILTG